VFLVGCTPHPSAAWVSQQARTLAWDLAEAGPQPAVLVRDPDAKFAPAFDTVFASEGLRGERTPVRAPRSNAIAERWVATVRRECLDRLLILGRHHVEAVLREFVEYYTGPGPTASLTYARRLPTSVPSIRPGRSSDGIGSTGSSTNISGARREHPE
jgi:putative transposase